MLWWKKSLAYLPAGNENDWTTPFHIAVSEGDLYMMYELLNQCPDCWDMLNSNGQNALHVAILNDQEELFMMALFDQYSGICNSLVDEPDNDGNTPLHLLAASRNYVPQFISNHPRPNKMSFNKQNQTPLDIASSRTWTKKKEKLVGDLRSINGRLGQRELKVKRKTKMRWKIQHMRDEEDDQGKAKSEKIDRERIMKASQIQVVVATLLMTVTFAAGFTLPGGLESDAGPNKGMAILVRKTAFRAFLISDVFAFACSAGALCVYFVLSDVNVEIEYEEIQTHWYKVLRKLYDIAGYLQLLALIAVVVAFITGMYATLASSTGLAVSVCVIGCITFLIYLWIIISFFDVVD